MAIVAFPSGYNLARDSGFRNASTEQFDVMSDGAPRSRRVTSKRYVSIACRFGALYRAEKDALELFIVTNAANTITWTIDGINYSGRIIGDHSTTMSGILFNLSFDFYGEIV
jgi:hypothetical protein